MQKFLYCFFLFSFLAIGCKKSESVKYPELKNPEYVDSEEHLLKSIGNPNNSKIGFNILITSGPTGVVNSRNFEVTFSNLVIKESPMAFLEAKSEFVKSVVLKGVKNIDQFDYLVLRFETNGKEVAKKKLKL